MIKEEIQKLVERAIKDLQEEKKFPEFELPEVFIFNNVKPIIKGHGDYSTNIIFELRKKIKVKIVKEETKEITDLLIEKIKNDKDFNYIFEKIEVANAGFMNFFLKEEYLQNQIKEIIRQKDRFGNLEIGDGEKVNVEFISANPTGPLTLGNGRGGFCGDVLSNVLIKAGYSVTKEYYINDRGNQIIKLGHSILGDSEAVYIGEYIDELRKKNKKTDPEKVGEAAVEVILKKMIKPAVKRIGINFDIWFSEKSLYNSKEVDKAIDDLTKRGFTYKSEGAVWFKSKDLGDDKDRVLVRKDGIRTYFASDIAYLKNKVSRGFEKIVLFVGADHYGYIARLRAMAHTLNFKKENIDVIVEQMVKLFKDGEEVKMSKRAGDYVTLDELLDEVSLDVARFFFLIRGADTHLNFDLDLAKEQSQKNPVYYIQYAYARISSILKKKKPSIFIGPDYRLLTNSAELNLIKQLIRFPEIIQEIAEDYQVQRLPQYATDLADAFHRFYEKCRVIGEKKKLTQARLSLILATRIVLKNTLSLMGVSSPEKM
ncbi:arginine--tRNA ligase [Patescibacteria group bacterium]|nr:arginine--tRNA ligase [Patescibacteria group bacterium]